LRIYLVYSIIIPTLNEEKLLTRLLKQLDNSYLKSVFEYEIIVSDGGSTDNTLAIAKEYADKVIEHCHREKTNIAEGRNRGAKEAEGLVLIFLNADIFIDRFNRFLQYVDDYFMKDRNIAMTCKVKVSPYEETFQDKIFMNFYNKYFSTLNFMGVGMGRGECQIVRRNIFEKLGGYNENIYAGEDFDLFRRIRQIGKIKYEQNIVIYESPRRYRKYGHFNIFYSWLVNSVSVILFGKSISKEWEQVR
jgi:glycosyltransferase involved in cell wall biosynthesis